MGHRLTLNSTYYKNLTTSLNTALGGNKSDGIILSIDTIDRPRFDVTSKLLYDLQETDITYYIRY